MQAKLNNHRGSGTSPSRGPIGIYDEQCLVASPPVAACTAISICFRTSKNQTALPTSTLGCNANRPIALSIDSCSVSRTPTNRRLHNPWYASQRSYRAPTRSKHERISRSCDRIGNEVRNRSQVKDICIAPGAARQTATTARSRAPLFLHRKKFLSIGAVRFCLLRRKP